MFQPGYLRREHVSDWPYRQRYFCDIHYEVREHPAEGVMLHFRVRGEVNERPFAEEFALHRDTAFNFFSVVSRIAVQHGVRLPPSPIVRARAEYDAMFNDIRAKLGARSGEPVNLDNLAKDGF